MRGDQDARPSPQRVLGRQGFRVGHVERARIRPVESSARQGVGIDQPPAGHVDKQGLVREQFEFPGTDQAFGLGRVCGAMRKTTLA